MDVILLAAGLGERMRPLSNFYAKPVLPVVGKPLLTHLIELFKEVGCRNFIIITGPDRNAIDRAVQLVNGIKVQYVVQDPPRGMGHALQCVKAQVSPLPPQFILSATDVLYDVPGIRHMVENHQKSQNDATLSLVKSPDKRFANGHGNVVVNDNLQVVKIVEKPGESHALSDYYSLPTYIFTADIFAVLDEIKPSVRGEVELQDAIEKLIENGHKIQGIPIIPEQESLDYIGKYHITTISDYLLMNITRLKGIVVPDLESFPTMIEPLYIDPNVTLQDSCFIGPYVYIRGPCILMEGVEVSETIIFENTHIGRGAKLHKCVVLPRSKVPPNARMCEVVITENRLISFKKN